jgi:hypothetical protein
LSRKVGANVDQGITRIVRSIGFYFQVTVRNFVRLRSSRVTCLNYFCREYPLPIHLAYLPGQLSALNACPFPKCASNFRHHVGGHALGARNSSSDRMNRVPTTCSKSSPSYVVILDHDGAIGQSSLTHFDRMVPFFISLSRWV